MQFYQHLKRKKRVRKERITITTRAEHAIIHLSAIKANEFNYMPTTDPLRIFVLIRKNIKM